MTRSIIALILLSSVCSGQQIYDILLKNGHVIDPTNHRDGQFDIAIVGNKIASVGHDLPAAHARVVVEASKYYVTPGLIDIQAHVDTQGAALNLEPDHTALPNGVTTVVDAGGAGWKNFANFKLKVIGHAKTRVLAFLNLSAMGFTGRDTPNDLPEMDPEAVARVIGENSKILVGITIAHFRPRTWDVVDRAEKAAALSHTVVLLDFPTGPAGDQPDTILKHIRPGDIITHVYGSLAPQLDRSHNVQPWLEEARKRGVLLDVGHGAQGFWFRIAAPAIQQGFLPDTISTDLDQANVLLPRATMAATLSKLLNLGMSVQQLIERTTVNPARAIRRPELGTLSEGSVADVALFEVQNGSFGFLDSGYTRLSADRRLRCVLTIRNGAVVWDSEGLTAPDASKAGPYSNFK
ncbi:MAG TPA: amidohydrolase/deacetylase family metallohydrolase [Bryobacteraceae bacterium]|nr:amidohydrolase/deacetylase family metallohydrolase [Bryobacteraceae bacterium]